MPNRNKTPYEDGISLNVRVLPFLLTSFSRFNPNVRESSPELKVFSGKYKLRRRPLIV